VNRIKLLSEQVANQIAAGEVVERPASVVKELVENSLDADAKKITVEIGAGGRSLIRVTDDGFGMSRDDALLCLERHATSKIQRAEDLASIATMGFRGEALPSIASVSRFTLTTRERESDSPEGTQIIIAGGKISEVKAAGSAPGTSIEVRQLFFNLPARRKFLRTEETEAAHIQHYLTLAALAFPEVAFTFVKDGRNVWQLPAVKSGAATSSRIEALRERFRALLGDEKLLPVNFSASLEENFRPKKPKFLSRPRCRKNRKSEIGNPNPRLGFDRFARRLARDARRPVCFREPPPGGKSRRQLRAHRRLSQLADERPLSGLLPVSRN
jgi:DNA mismatch repair protein MutL